jgi:DmsE family decaheme c-type cytochrome
MDRRRISLPAAATAVMALLWAGVLFARSGAQAPGQAPEGILLPSRTRQQTVEPAKKADPAPAAKANAPQVPSPPPAAAGAELVGDDEACLTCHEQQKQGYSNTMHGRKEHPRAPAAKQGCESCHGPGSKHVDDPEVPGMIRAFTNDAPRDGNDTCLTCHSRGMHALWEGSAHDSRNVSCSSCHSVHAFKSERAQLKTVREMDTCATCHRDKVAKIDRSGHMPVREMKMECSTCHNPHGSTNVRQLQKGDSIGEMCTSCHADKRGPYLWEHAPSRDGCVTCHDPHGSANERMLVTKPPILCQRCHIATRHPSTIYDAGLIGSGATPSVRIYARSCVTCHSAIHGSNHPSGQRFIR